MDGDSTTALSSVFQCLIPPSVKQFSQYPIEISSGASGGCFLWSCAVFPGRKAVVTKG